MQPDRVYRSFYMHFTTRMGREPVIGPSRLELSRKLARRSRACHASPQKPRPNSHGSAGEREREACVWMRIAILQRTPYIAQSPALARAPWIIAELKRPGSIRGAPARRSSRH